MPGVQSSFLNANSSDYSKNVERHRQINVLRLAEVIAKTQIKVPIL